MSTTLAIDTTSSQKIRITLEIDGRQLKKVSERASQKAQMVLPLIENVLAENNLKFTDITEIKVNTGPGSFTGLRVGITIAKMLGSLLTIPVNGKSAKSSIVPRYDASKYDLVE